MSWSPKVHRPRAATVRIEYRRRSWADDFECADVSKRIVRAGPPGPWTERDRSEAIGLRGTRFKVRRPVLVSRLDQDQVAGPIEGPGHVKDVSRRFVREGQGRDPLCLGKPDREIGDHRTRADIERMTGGRHADRKLLEEMCSPGRVGGER